MECKELVTQVIEESGKPIGVGEATQRLEIPGSCWFLGWKDKGKSWITLLKLEPPLACPSGDPEAGRKGNTAHLPPPVTCWCLPLAKPSLRPSSWKPANIPATPTGRLRAAQNCTRETVKAKPALHLGPPCLLNNPVLASEIHRRIDLKGFDRKYQICTV